MREGEGGRKGGREIEQNLTPQVTCSNCSNRKNIIYTVFMVIAR